LAVLGSAAHGVVTRGQLQRQGLTDEEIDHRVESGALLREHRGVYRVGHRAPSIEATYLAAVLACGPGALLSGRAAGYLYGVVQGDTPPPEVTSPTERRIPGVLTRRARRRDVPAATWRRIPVTSVEQMLVDLAAVLDSYELGRACHEAAIRYGTTPAAVEARLDQHPNSRGAGRLRAILRGDAKVTLSKLERRFVVLLREAGLPLPETNRPAGGRRVDCRWPRLRLTVELDSYRFHGSRHAWEQDRRREREAYARGDQFRRYTWGDVFERTAAMLHELRALLTPPPS
jgi:hypothetical protein